MYIRHPGSSNVGVNHTIKIRTKTTSEIGPTNHSPEGGRNFGVLLYVLYQCLCAINGPKFKAVSDVRYTKWQKRGRLASREVALI